MKKIKTRRHHNNTGLRGIKNGQTRKFAKKLKSKYVKPDTPIQPMEERTIRGVL